MQLLFREAVIDSKKNRTGRGFLFLIVVGSGFLSAPCRTRTEKAHTEKRENAGFGDANWSIEITENIRTRQAAVIGCKGGKGDRISSKNNDAKRPRRAWMIRRITVRASKIATG